MNHIEINDRSIGPGYPTYVAVEMSSTHNQNYDQTVELVKAAKEAGADAINLQTANPDALTLDSDRVEFRLSHGTLWDGETLHYTRVEGNG